MDKSWILKDKNSQKYDDGVQAFIEYANAHAKKNDEGNVRCPCVNCKNFKFKDNDTIYEHLICDGILRSYTIWSRHGEEKGPTSTPTTKVERRDDDSVGNHNGDNIRGMLEDLHPDVNANIDGVVNETSQDSTPMPDSNFESAKCLKNG
ncbi:hypothetical protein BVC80_8303g2 [Macleaya cordata]|uniref:Transposase-associated domain-containing protein n=1 Tax=Macleaya cordata TaxID=56857 RepID=A0A200QRL5_MACCD|nr:hypothetical protein BVC80_8303g2 [Macleaya cordata]